MELLNMPDRPRLKGGHGQTEESPEDGTLLRSDQKSPEDCILLRSACLEFKKEEFGIGPFGAVRTKKGSEIRFPLGRIVCVKSVHESRLLGILAMVAGVVQPTSGDVFFPEYLRRVMNPTEPVHDVGNLTSLEELLATGVMPRQAAALLKCLDIDPDQIARHLSPGQTQLLTLLRALLRDPEVLVVARPVAFVSPNVQRNAFTLLRVWQAHGGANGLLRLCDEVKIDKDGDDVWVDTRNSSLGVEDDYIGQRTVIIYSYAYGDLHSSADVIIDLDQFWESGGDKALDVFVGPTSSSTASPLVVN